jgi:1-aminocyclopropane-1-carboxylate deaminase/D-cysteine desulfhydrase-like pyridoxal-dependent ACC family enzyme
MGNLMVDRMVGAQLRFVTKAEYALHGSKALLASLCDELKKSENGGRRPYSIPVGGSNGLGTWGYIDAVEEMKEQCTDTPPPAKCEEPEIDETRTRSQSSGFEGITDLCFACGSGGTAAAPRTRA